MNGKSYNDETKAAVMAALLAGQSISSVARQYNVPKGTVRGWREKAFEFASEATQKKDKSSIGDALLNLVQTELESLTQISIITRDPQWIKTQSAADLAVFVGVKTDKLMRMLEAFGQSDTNSDDPNGPI